MAFSQGNDGRIVTDGRVGISTQNPVSEKIVNPEPGWAKDNLDFELIEYQKAQRRLAFARWTGPQTVAFEWSRPESSPIPRQFAQYPFYGALNVRFAVGGDVKDSNAAGGGSPNYIGRLGNALPVRKTPWFANLSRNRASGYPGKIV